MPNALGEPELVKQKFPNSPIDEPKERIIDLSEVSRHDGRFDCWIVLYDRVYDITNFIDEHPGGEDVLLEYAGKDSTIAFRGTGHSSYAIRSLKQFLIGELPLQERIYRRPNGFKISDLPD
ncbi:uncharacterized protein LOC132703542 [Cylas formicarius]|uniref:uncharacterized protein LOC132703542 n=1 Tax=Cylas formicarius TaxID=197179 RepID=UPI002958DAA4|nr:uncharacterized protein LOC132703542 [Cylas formicarius]